MTMTRTVDVHVTDEHIQKGLVSASLFCPISRAINDLLQYPYLYRVATSYSGVQVFNDHLNYGVPLPWEAFSFMLRFDDELPVAPFTFQLELPVEILK